MDLDVVLIIGGVGGLAGLIGGFFAGADNLIGTILMGVIGGLAASAIMRIAGAPPVYGLGNDFSVVWGAAGGLLLGFVVGRSNV
jgi:hypothetical protein